MLRFLLGSIFLRSSRLFGISCLFETSGWRHFVNAYLSVNKHEDRNSWTRTVGSSLSIYENFIVLVKTKSCLTTLDDKYKPEKKTLQRQLSVTSISAARGLWRVTGKLPVALKKSYTFSQTFSLRKCMELSGILTVQTICLTSCAEKMLNIRDIIQLLKKRTAPLITVALKLRQLAHVIFGHGTKFRNS